MKVYTHYYPINEKEGFRWRTLLQFGDSWDCIGSVVMKNPGSSSGSLDPITDTKTLNELCQYEQSADEWYEFGEDPTMKCVGDLFAYKYNVPKRECLSGVIQVFNLFYVREADIQKALEKSNEFGIPCRFSSVEEMTSYDIHHLVAPVYLGFSNLAWSKEYGHRARLFYDAVKKLAINDKQYAGDYLDDFDKNPYIHPQALMQYQKNAYASHVARLRFKENCPDSKKIEGNPTVILSRILPLIKRKDILQWIHNENGRMYLVNEFFTETKSAGYSGRKAYKENIAVDLFEKNGEFRVEIFHRNNSEVITRSLVADLWDAKIEYMPCEHEYKHLYKKFAIDSSIETIVQELNQLFDKILAYRNRKYPINLLHS